MVASKADQAKKKGGNKSGNGRKGKMNMKNRVNIRAGVGMGAMRGAMFNPNQMLDNPGYMDFNEPIVGGGHHMNLRPQPPLPGPSIRPLKGGARGPVNNSNKKNRPNNRRQNMQRGQQPPSGWGPMPLPNIAPIIPPMMNNRGPPGLFRGPMPPPRMMGPPMGRPPLPPGLIPPQINSRFGPRPPIPPPLMGRPPLGMPRPPLGMGVPLPLRQSLPRGGGAPGLSPIRRNKTNRRNNKKNKSKKGAGANVNGTQASNKKPLANKQNQYELDKPWVTDEIKAEHKKKEDLQNKLKGRKDDKLFEEFKVQREKFVKLYDAAKDEYVKKNPEKTKV